MCMRYYWELVKHFFLANSRHGTHSPFVYKLADTVIYRAPRVDGVGLKFPVHFSVRYAALLNDMLVFMGLQSVGDLSTTVPTDAVWLDLTEVSVIEVKKLVKAGMVVVVHEPYRTRETLAKWRSLIADHDLQVSIDLFHFGLLLHRDEQRKENFVLRYPYTR
ncbi:hypothetical protein SAMN05660862_1406 [Sphingobacterium psychroaquaticum]|uniref:Uncharacterized protein n=2 Tax=Sphingobacterium psychroaquaticum TaxID=561061 RepID=A0A1X7J3J3_9SPHI|nr:hypothetical protein SAMN05660862_1406 [Sphingobacterium psychroaquaticum]